MYFSAPDSAALASGHSSLIAASDASRRSSLPAGSSGDRRSILITRIIRATTTDTRITTVTALRIIPSSHITTTTRRSFQLMCNDSLTR